MFVKVNLTDLVVGVKYAILRRADFLMYFTCTFKGYQENRRTFHYVKSHYYLDNIDTYNAIRHLQGMDMDISFYVFVPQKEKIQQKMEKRALNQILKQLVNDDFTW
jgi:hypothetical protein